jgi:hypothetical protein
MTTIPVALAALAKILVFAEGFETITEACDGTFREFK